MWESCITKVVPLVETYPLLITRMCNYTECQKHSVQAKNTWYRLYRVSLGTRHSIYVPSGQFHFTLGGSLTLGILYIVPSVFKTLGTKEQYVQKLRCHTDLTVPGELGWLDASPHEGA
jgi:hypothetical protein